MKIKNLHHWMGTAPESTIKSTIRLRPFFVKLACSPHVYVQPLSIVVTPQSPNAVSGVRFIGDSKLATSVNVSVSPTTNY